MSTKAVVTIPLSEFDDMRDKAKRTEALEDFAKNFNDILRRHVICVLSETVTHFCPERKGKLNLPIPVNVDWKACMEGGGIIQSSKVTIQEPNAGGYYKAEIIFTYPKKKNEA